MFCFAQLIVHGLVFKAYCMGYYPNPKAIKDLVNILKNSGAHLKYANQQFVFLPNSIYDIPCLRVIQLGYCRNAYQYLFGLHLAVLQRTACIR